MNEQTNNNLDHLAKKVIKESAIERPSFNFTEAVMSQVEVLNNNKATVYRPLISKVGWGIIIALCLAVVLYVVFSGSQMASLGWFDKYDFSFKPNLLSDLKLSKTVTYSILLFGVMFCVQVSLLKYHFNKRFEV